MILSFYRSKSHSFQNPIKTGFPGFLFLATRNPGLKILPQLGNTRFGGRNQHVGQISLNSERVRFSPSGYLTWNDPTTKISFPQIIPNKKQQQNCTNHSIIQGDLKRCVPIFCLIKNPFFNECLFCCRT